MAPSTNTTRPRTGSLSLKNHSNNNYSRGVGENQNPQNNQNHHAAAQQYYQSLTRGGKKKLNSARSSTSFSNSRTTGIERSYNSITSTIKGGIASFDASLDSRGGGHSGRSSMESNFERSSVESYSTRGGHHQQSKQRSLDKTPMTSNRRTTTTNNDDDYYNNTSSQTTTSSSFTATSGGTLFGREGIKSVPSFAPSLSSTREEDNEVVGYQEDGGSYGGGYGGVESVPSFASSTLNDENQDLRRASLREIKAALREEKRKSTSNNIAPSSFGTESREECMEESVVEDDESLVEDDESVIDPFSLLRGGDGGGGCMESVPSFASNEEGMGVRSVPSFATESASSLQQGGDSNRGGISMASSSRNTNNSSRRCQLEEMLGYEKKVGSERMPTMANPHSRVSLDTFQTETSSFHTNNNNNNNNTEKSSSLGSTGLYSATNPHKKNKERESLDTFKSKTSQAVCKMSQASFGKIRDILSGEGGGHHPGGNGGGHTSGAAPSNTLIGGYRESGIGLGGILQFGVGRTNNTADEEMSFFVSDNNGQVHKEKVQGGGHMSAQSNTLIGGYRESGMGLGGILQFGGRSNNNADEEMSFFVSDNNGEVHKEKVPLEVREAFVNDGAMMAADDLDGQKKKKNKKVVLLEQERYHQLGETMKTTNVSRGVEKSNDVSFQQQQQRSLFHMKKGENKMTTAPQSPLPAPSGNTPPLVRSVKKATRAVSHSMKHEVVPATKAMAALTVKLVERGEKKMKDGVAPKLRAVALDIDSRLNHHHQQQTRQQGFVGLKHIEGKGDYVFDPDYQVTTTPQHIDQAGRRAYGPNPVHNFDPNTPACLLGALTAGTMFNYDITHPEHPEYLPEGIPRVLDVPGDWEELAGFIPAAALVERVGGRPVDLDDAVEESEDDENERVEEMLALQQGVAMSYANELAQEEGAEEEVVTDEEDARNASMWVAYNPDEDVEEEDEVMNLGEIIVATGAEFGGEGNEFTPRSLETGDSSTYYLGDLSVGVTSDDDESEEQKETAIVTFQQEQQVPIVETFEDDNCNESEYDANENHPAEENYAETPMKKLTYADGEIPSQQQQQFTDKKKKEFQTPFSVKKGERPLTFEEFRAMNRRVLFNNEEQEPERQEENKEASPEEMNNMHAEPTQAIVKADIGRNIETEEQSQREMTVEHFVSGAVPSSGHRQRELKGRVVMIRIKKKISKGVKKALKQLLLTAKVGRKKTTSSNMPITETDFIITIPGADASAVPDSPSAMSIASSLLSAAISNSSKRVIGAAPFNSNASAVPDYLYGAVNYHNRSYDDGSDDEYGQLSPPPKMTSNHASEHDDEDVVSFLAEAMNQGLNVDEVLAIEDGQEGVEEEEEQMYLVLTPSDGGVEKVTQVISGNVEGTPVVFNEIMHKNEEGSEIKPHNLSIMFDSGKKGANNNSFQIMDSEEAGGNIVLTPTESNQNVGHVFRRSFGSADEASASILQSSTFDSEDETLVTHDGNTLVRTDTKDTHDHTIATTTSLKEEEKQPASTFKITREEDPEDTGTSPALPAYSKQAASNASFLFSPDNMGRANPRIRAKERALLRNQSYGGSITMLPSASSMDKSEQQLVLMPKPSYSFDYLTGGEVKYDSAPSMASEASVEDASSDEPDTPSTAATVVQKKPVMASMTKDRQFSFKTIRKQFSTDPLDSNQHVPRVVEQRNFASPGVAFASGESQSKTPVVTNAVRKKLHAATPFTKTTDSSPSSSPSTSSIISFKSGGRRNSSPKVSKTLPKSAAKTRTGLVKDRISMFQQRVDMPSAVTGVNGRLKRNHSYRLKNERRETNGGGALAPRKAVLKSSAFIRTVPIGISTSYFRDEATFEESPDRAGDARVEQLYTQNESLNGEDDSVDEPNSYVKQYMTTSKVDEKAESFGRSSLDSSSCSVSEATELDAFNSLLGKFDDDDSSVESESSEETQVRQKHNENVSMSPNALPSTFKSATLVKPNEINHNRTPLTAQKWRSMAAIHGSQAARNW
jgi:hypothetical protein